MRLLLDTHTLLWWVHEPERLTSRVIEAVSEPDNEIFVSPVSAMEIATKQRRNRLDYDTPLATNFIAEVIDLGFNELRISGDHAQLAGGLKGPNQDPWDRLLAAQAQIEKLLLVSRDAHMTGLNIVPFW